MTILTEKCYNDYFFNWKDKKWIFERKVISFKHDSFNVRYVIFLIIYDIWGFISLKSGIILYIILLKGFFENSIKLNYQRKLNGIFAKKKKKKKKKNTNERYNLFYGIHIPPKFVLSLNFILSNNK